MTTDNAEAPLRITPDEVAAAPLPPQHAWRPTPPPPREQRPPRLSQLAAASLVLALLGIPLLGILLGPIATVCGALALASVEKRSDLRGFGIALAGTLLGILDLIGWAIGLWWWVGVADRDPRHAAPPPILSEAHTAVGIDDAPHPIREALRANVRLVCDTAGHVGSGVVVGHSGGRTLVLTNRHVADCPGGETGALRASFADGTSTAATILWTPSDGIDLAIVVVGSTGVTPVPLAPAPAVRIGDPVFAVGNPLGFDATYTAGVVSAARTMPVGSSSLRVYQVQASINPGHSGGGLYTRDGKLIGINTWIAGLGTLGSISFAIGTDSLRTLLESSDRDWAGDLLAPARVEAEGEP